uniref:Uncharacterized protein n=1 Tax=Vespula pensylvanica TaxID=30213 RepID=A0A834UB58_VESPE|nr:hypothetical protein H0235_007275 [Vespula pensylvanica]
MTKKVPSENSLSAVTMLWPGGNKYGGSNQRYNDNDNDDNDDNATTRHDGDGDGDGDDDVDDDDDDDDYDNEYSDVDDVSCSMRYGRERARSFLLSEKNKSRAEEYKSVKSTA